MNVVIRRYRIRLGAVELVARYARETLLPRLRQVSGFVAYYLVNAGDGLVASIALFEGADGARAGDDLSAEWFRVDWPAFRAVPPAMTSGEVLLAEESRRVTAIAAPGGVPRLERRTLVERRGAADRRTGQERRAEAARAAAARA